MFEDLPHELLFATFDNFILAELLKLRLVSKHLKEVTDAYLLQELEVKQISCAYKQTWILLNHGRLLNINHEKLTTQGLLSSSELTSFGRIEQLSCEFENGLFLTKDKKVYKMSKTKNSDGQLVNTIVPLLVPTMTSSSLPISIATKDFTSAILFKSGNTLFFSESDENQGITAHKMGKTLKLLPTWLISHIPKTITDISYSRNDYLGITQDKMLMLAEFFNGTLTTWNPLGYGVNHIKATDSGRLILTHEHELLIAGKGYKELFNLSDDISFKSIEKDILLFDASDMNIVALTSDNKLIIFELGFHNISSSSLLHSINNNPASHSDISDLTWDDDESSDWRNAPASNTDISNLTKDDGHSSDWSADEDENNDLLDEKLDEEADREQTQDNPLKKIYTVNGVGFFKLYQKLKSSPSSQTNLDSSNSPPTAPS